MSNNDDACHKKPANFLPRVLAFFLSFFYLTSSPASITLMVRVLPCIASQDKPHNPNVLPAINRWDRRGRRRLHVPIIRIRIHIRDRCLIPAFYTVFAAVLAARRSLLFSFPQPPQLLSERTLYASADRDATSASQFFFFSLFSTEIGIDWFYKNSRLSRSLRRR